MLEKFSQAFYSDDFQSLFVLDDEIQGVLKKSPNVFNLINSNQEYRKYHEDAMFYEESLGHIFSSEWDLVSESNDIKVESHYSGADFYTKASVLIGSNIMKTLAVLNEVDLLSSWYEIFRIHALSQVQVLAAPAKFKKLMKYQFWFPWPLTNRECLLEFSAYPVAEKQGMLIIMRTPHDKYLNFDLPPENLETVRMSIPIGCLFIQYISQDITKVSILVQANASLISYTLLPEWLLNFGKKQIMYFVMDSLRQTVLAFEGSEYENRVRDKADFYSFLQTVLIRDAAID